MENLRVALVGAGGIAQSYLDVVAAKNAEIDIVAIVEPDAGRAAVASSESSGKAVQRCA